MQKYPEHFLPLGLPSPRIHFCKMQRCETNHLQFLPFLFQCLAFEKACPLVDPKHDTPITQLSKNSHMCFPKFLNQQYDTTLAIRF